MTSINPFLNTVTGEAVFFRALCEARPIGIHREFHMMTVARHIENVTREKISVDDLWIKFRECYNPAVLEQYEHLGYSDTGSTSTSDDDMDGEEADGKSRRRSSSSHPNPKPKSRDYPRVGDDLDRHPFFKHEFALPEGYGDYIYLFYRSS
jgi:MRG-binding protein